MQKKSVNKKNIIFLAIYILFYLLIYLMNGVRIAPDTIGYTTGVYMREPLYPTFLALFRWLFGEGIYLEIIVFIQCMLAAIAAWRFTIVLDRVMKLELFSNLVIVGIQCLVVLLCNHLDKTYCNGVISEGIAIPLFQLFVAELILYVCKRHIKNFLLCAVYAVGLLCTRKHMYIVLLILLVVYMAMWVFKKIDWRTLGLMVLSVIAIWGCSRLIDCCYNFAWRGEWMTHTADATPMLCTAIYSSEKEDGYYFADEEMRQLFFDIMEQMEEKEYTFRYAAPGWRNLRDHYAENYDAFKEEVIKPCFYAFLQEHYELSDSEAAKMFDELSKEMIRTLVPANWKTIAKVTGSNMVFGFCRSISKSDSKYMWYNVLFYTVYVMLLTNNLFSKKKKEEVIVISGVALIVTVVNVVVVGVMIFTQLRYMVYNIPLMYVGMYLLVKEKVLECHMRFTGHIGRKDI